MEPRCYIYGCKPLHQDNKSLLEKVGDFMSRLLKIPRGRLLLDTQGGVSWLLVT